MGKLRGHGFSEETIANILTDRFTFVRYLMPEAQSVLLCDKADFKAIMDFLFYAISVCTDRRLNDLLTKAMAAVGERAAEAAAAVAAKQKELDAAQVGV